MMHGTDKMCVNSSVQSRWNGTESMTFCQWKKVIWVQGLRVEFNYNSHWTRLNRQNSCHDKICNALIIDLDNIINTIDMLLVLPINYLIYFYICINVNTNESLVLIIYFEKTYIWKIKNEGEVTILNDKTKKTLLEMSIHLFLISLNKGIDYVWNKCVLAVDLTQQRQQTFNGLKAIISNMVLLNNAILSLINACTINGETNYYGDHKFGTQHGTQSIHDRLVSTNAATADCAARHTNAGFVVAAVGENKHVTLPLQSAMCAIYLHINNGKIQLLLTENGYFGIDSLDSYRLDAILSDEIWQYYAF